MTTSSSPTLALHVRRLLAGVPGVRPMARMAADTVEYARLVRSYRAFRRMADEADDGLPLRWKDRQPCLRDRTATTPFDRHYIYHPAWAARIIARNRPARHVDISSALAFGTLLSAFIPVAFYDYRPAALGLSGLDSMQADLMALPFEDDSVESISCMHVLEHVGLGRYGDPIDPQGDRKAMDELARVVAPGGTLLVVVPVGRPRIMFNAHRVYAWEMILERFKGLRLEASALIPDNPEQGGLISDPDASLAAQQTYGCGCFWFIKS